MDHVRPANNLWKLFPPTPPVLLVATGLIVLGLLPAPRHWLLLRTEPIGDGWLWAVLGAVQLSALAPFGLALIVTATGVRISSLLAHGLAWLILPVGLLLTVGAAAFSGAGDGIILLQGALLTMALIGVLLGARRGRSAPSGRTLAGSMVLIPAIAAVWSLATVPVVLASAHRVADGAPFCLAGHAHGPAPLGSLWDLRWFSFYTTGSGYKETSRWFFHGLLTIQTAEGEKIYNWSPRGMHFDPVDRPDLYLIDPRGACVPSRRWQL